MAMIEGFQIASLKAPHLGLRQEDVEVQGIDQSSMIDWKEKILLLLMPHTLLEIQVLVIERGIFAGMAKSMSRFFQGVVLQFLGVLIQKLPQKQHKHGWRVVQEGVVLAIFTHTQGGQLLHHLKIPPPTPPEIQDSLLLGSQS